MWSTSNGSIEVNGRSSSSSSTRTSDFDEIKIPVPWGYISGKWWGPRNVQPIIAIHGWQDNAGTFDTLAPLLKAGGIPVLCVDLPGHGLSSHYPGGLYYYIFWDGVHILRRIVQYFNWAKITIIGHSLGGGIAFLYAATFPDDVEKYISIDIAAPVVREPAKVIAQMGENVDRFLKYERLAQEQQPNYKYEEMIDIVVDAYKGSVTRKSCEILMKRGMKLVPQSDSYLFARDARLKAVGLGFLTYEQVLELAKCIKCEVMSIRAKPGLIFDKPEYYEAVIEKLKETASRVENCVVSGSHHVHLNNPERVAPLILKFLQS